MAWPKWKRDLLEVLDEQTHIPLIQQLESGAITEAVLLFLNLGISAERMHALATLINRVVRANAKKQPAVFLTSEQLSACQTLKDVLELVGKSVE